MARPEPPLVVGVDVGGTKIASAQVAPDGTVGRRDRRPTNADRPPDDVLDDVASSVRVCLDPAAPRAAVGLAIAGQTDRESGILRASPNLPGWRDVPVRQGLSDRLGLPVWVTNDVRAAAWGEWRHGAGQGVSHLVCVFVGTGIGGGVVLDGRMLEGANGTAGELGHQTIDVGRGRACRCPNRGCLEAYAGGWAIAERAREAVARDPGAGAALVRAAGDAGHITAAHVTRAHVQGDALATRLVDETAAYLAAGLTGIVNAFNPHRLVLGGGVLEGAPDLVGRAAALLRTRALTAALDVLDVVPARLGSDAGIVGASAYARERLSRSGAT